MLKDVFHVDPITLVVVVCGFLATWITLKNDSKWHTSWIRKHDAECDEQRIMNNKLFTELQVTSGKLTEIAQSNNHRLDRLEIQADRRDH